MIAKVAFFCAALAAVHATSLLAPTVYGHGLAIKAPAAPLLTAPLLTKSVVAAPAAVTYQSSVVSHAAPIALHAPVAYTTVAKAAPVAYTTVTRTAPIAPVLGYSGLLGAAPLAYSGYGLAGHGLNYKGYAAPAVIGHGLTGHGLAYTTGYLGHGYTGHGLAYAPGVLGLNKYGYGKVLL